MRQGAPELIKEHVRKVRSHLRVRGQTADNLNNTLHDHRLVIRQLPIDLGLDHIFQRRKVLQPERLQITEKARGVLLFKVGSLATLVGDRTGRSMEHLCKLLEDSGSVFAFSTVAAIR